MAKKKSGSQFEPEPAAAVAGGATGTYVYFLLKADGTILKSYGAGTGTLDGMLSAGWTALREEALAGGGVLLVLKR